MGKIHSGNINRPRYQRIVNVLKTAEYPPSAEEVCARIQTLIGKIPQALSTTIGEIRNEQDEHGVRISMATCWRAAEAGEELGMKVNKNGGITFVIERATEPWHDGRPRYWLEAAPGWVPHWRINERGALVNCGLRIADCGFNSSDSKNSLDSTDSVLVCMNPRCGKPLPEGHAGPPFCPGPQDACRKAYFEGLQMSLI